MMRQNVVESCAVDFKALTRKQVAMEEAMTSMVHLNTEDKGCRRQTFSDRD